MPYGPRWSGKAACLSSSLIGRASFAVTSCTLQGRKQHPLAEFGVLKYDSYPRFEYCEYISLSAERRLLLVSLRVPVWLVCDTTTHDCHFGKDNASSMIPGVSRQGSEVVYSSDSNNLPYLRKAHVCIRRLNTSPTFRLKSEQTI